MISSYHFHDFSSIIDSSYGESFLFVRNPYNILMQSIFESSITPLASLLRPERLDDLVGQQHLIGE